ncbi:MAG TPA: response regulator [Polyangiaceae bacterium]
MMRVLFVDDEPRVLQGIEQVLRRKRKVWEMVFAGGPEAALAELERGRFDAVISDMRMPRMDGAELLNRVRLTQPAALRFVLSGQMDEAGAVRAAGVAHRYLAKPCDSEVLIATLSRALELRAQIASDSVRTCIGGMAGLPSLPASCAALNQVLDDPRAALNDVVRIVESDVGMSAKVLQLVNSAFFGLPRQVSSIELAVSQLGMSAIRSLVLANALFQALAGNDFGLVQTEQARSLLAARFARRFPIQGRLADVAATAALLHNVGRLALITQLPDEHRANLEYARLNGTSCEEAERVRLGVSHDEIGAYLLGLWGLPPDVVEAVGTHLSALTEVGSVLTPGAVVYLAQLLAGPALQRAGADADGPPTEILEGLGATEIMATLRAEIAAASLGQERVS